jgi:hypothetical protein
MAAYNKRVKLIADLMETAKKYNCIIPKDVIKRILNDKDNAKVFRITDYKDISKVIKFAEELINKRKISKKELY